MAKFGYIYGGEDGDGNVRSKRIPLMPNPFPDNIYELVAIAASMNGLAYSLYKLINLWIEDRKAKKIVIKKGDMEVEIHGGASDKEIKKVLANFNKLAKVKTKNDVEVVIPKNCDPDIPVRLLFKSKD